MLTLLSKTTSSRKLPAISRKGGPNVAHKNQKLLFVMKVAQKTLKKKNMLLANVGTKN